MPALKLLIKLIGYYVAVAVIVAIGLWLFPTWSDYLPIGRVQSLIAQAGGPLMKGQAHIQIAHVGSIGESIVWLVSAMMGALLTALPVSWVYMEIRHSEQYDQSLIGTIVILPLVVTSIVIIVQDSLALSFSLAGIAGVARYRNSMKSSGDLLFILIAIGIGLASGIGAVELAIVTTIMFNLCFVAMWAVEFGERHEMKRYLSDFDPFDAESTGQPGVTVTETSTAVVMEEVTRVSRGPDVPADGPKD